MLKTEKLSMFKRRHLQQFPGDVPQRVKIAMLSDPFGFEDKNWYRNEETKTWESFFVPQPVRARNYRNDFAKSANRKLRHLKVEITNDED